MIYFDVLRILVERCHVCLDGHIQAPAEYFLHLLHSWCFSDALVEEEVGTSVANIFKHYGEGFFRDKEVS